MADSVANYNDLVMWAKSFELVPEENEPESDFRQRFAHHFLTKYDDPVVAREITLAKPCPNWTVMERAEFVLDYGNFFESPNGPRHRCYSIYAYCKTTAGHKVDVVKNRRTRKAGAIASNPAEFLTTRGTNAKDEFAQWDGKDPYWEGSKLQRAPRGFEEALLKRQACPTDDESQGPLVVRHFDKDGNSETKFIQPRDPPQSVVSKSNRLPEGVVALTKEEQEKAENP